MDASVLRLSDDALVVRYGSIRDPHVLAEKIATNVRRGLPPAVSVFAMDPRPGESAQETTARIVREAGLQHPKIQTSSHRDLKGAGFNLESDTTDGQARCHYNVDVAYPIDLRQLQRLIECFGLPEPKPRLEEVSEE